MQAPQLQPDIPSQSSDSALGHDWQGVNGGCRRLGCGSDCAAREMQRLREENASLREQLAPKSVRELIEHQLIKKLSDKQINDVLVSLRDQLSEAKLREREYLSQDPTPAMIGAIITGHLEAKDCVPGTSNWAAAIHAAIVRSVTVGRTEEPRHG